MVFNIWEWRWQWQWIALRKLWSLKNGFHQALHHLRLPNARLGCKEASWKGGLKETAQRMRHSATLQIPNRDDLTIGISHDIPHLSQFWWETYDEPVHLRTSYFQTNTHVYMHMQHDHICAAWDPHHWIHLGRGDMKGSCVRRYNSDCRCDVTPAWVVHEPWTGMKLDIHSWTEISGSEKRTPHDVHGCSSLSPFK